MYNKEFDNIEIPENIDLYIKKGLKKAVNEKKSKNQTRKTEKILNFKGTLVARAGFEPTTFSQ